MRYEWLETEGKPLRLYAKLMGAVIPDYYWENWFSPHYLSLPYMRRESLALMVELSVLGDRRWLSPDPPHWPSLLSLKGRLETLRAEKHTQP